MSSASNKTSGKKPRRTITRKTTSASAVSACPADGAGWCSYPFSPKQLEKRLKAKAKEQEQKETEVVAKTKELVLSSR